MRFFAITAAALASVALTSGHAFAQSASQDIQITATVPNVCTINNAGGVFTPAGAATIGIDAAGAVVTSSVSATGLATTFACNSNATITLASTNGGASLAGAVPLAQTSSGFQQVIDYTATATWNSGSAVYNTATTTGANASETAGTANTTGALAGSLTVSILPAANSAPLVAGNYSDTLRVTLTPR